MSDVNNIVEEMSYEFDWLKKCVKQFDVTIVEKNFSLIDKINHQNVLQEDEFKYF